MFADHRSNVRARTIAAAACAIAAVVVAAPAASAQGFFESLFGRRWSAPTAYADPFQQWNPFGSRSAEMPRGEMGGSAAFCVRLCDGRFFPVQRHGSMSPAHACSSFCPASQTRIYSGSTIEQAIGQDGRRYGELSTAFAYRDKIVAGCTCNGRDAFGLINIPVEDDPTLRPGDIVASNTGLLSYNGSGRRPSFTAVASHPGLAADLRQRLTETKIMPATGAAAVPPPGAGQDETTGSIRAGRNKRVQTER